MYVCGKVKLQLYVNTLLRLDVYIMYTHTLMFKVLHKFQYNTTISYQE